MPIQADIRPGLVPMLEAFGVPATVTRPAPNDTPIDTTALWIAPLPQDVPLGGGEFTRQEPRRVLALPLSEVPTVPTKTLIEAPEALGLPTQTWIVDSIDRIEYDHVRVMVLLLEPAS
jgi:hypothetical protein